MKTFPALQAVCAGNSAVTGEMPAKRPVTGSFDVFVDLHLNKRLSKRWWCWWFETPSRPLWRHCNDLWKPYHKIEGAYHVRCTILTNECTSAIFAVWFGLWKHSFALQWRHYERDGVSNNRRCLLNRLFRRRTKKTSTLRDTGLCKGTPTVTGGFPLQMVSNAENVFIWWRHLG